MTGHGDRRSPPAQHRLSRSRVQLGPQVIRLRPAPHCRTRVLSYSLTVAPKLHFLNAWADLETTYALRLPGADARVHRRRSRRRDGGVQPVRLASNPRRVLPFTYAPWLTKELAPYLTALPAGRCSPSGWLRCARGDAHHRLLVALNHRLQQEIGYVIRMEPGIQTCEETLASRRGSCRDTGWLLVQILRHLGLAARFVSGYLISSSRTSSRSRVRPARNRISPTCMLGRRSPPGAGWIGLDPPPGSWRARGTCRSRRARSGSAAPISGCVDAAGVGISFEMSIQRIRETPRVLQAVLRASSGIASSSSTSGG